MDLKESIKVIDTGSLYLWDTGDGFTNYEDVSMNDFLVPNTKVYHYVIKHEPVTLKLDPITEAWTNYNNFLLAFYTGRL